jgi:TPR repeat protein
MNNKNNKKQRLEGSESMSSQEIYDSLCELYMNWINSDRDYIDKLKNISSEQINNTNDSLAMNNLGFIFLCDHQYYLAENLFLESAKLGNFAAMYNLGCMYSLSEYSDFERQNISTAKHWFEQAIHSHGNENFIKFAMYDLGFIYEHEGLYKKAEECYLSSLDLGFNTAKRGLYRVYTALANKYLVDI